MEFKNIVLLVSLIFTAFLLFKEWNRKDKSRLYLRIVASVLVVGSLVLLILPLKYTVNSQISINKLILITNGIDLDSIPKNTELFTLDSTVIKENLAFKFTYLPTLDYYLTLHPEIQQLDIYGYGLASDDLATLKNYSINFHSVSSPSGFQSCSWNHEIAATQVLNVQGTYKNTSDKIIKLLLEGLGSPLDSISIAPKSEAVFSLSNTPKQEGNAVYNLFALSGKDTLSKEEIPFEVIKQLPIKVMILASTPDFEYKFLKNWLYENKYPVVARTRISKDKFGLSFLNNKSVDLNKINQQLLQQFDVLIADDAELAALNAKEKLALESQISQGMGLIIRITENKPISSFSKRFSFANPIIVKDKSYRLLIHNKKQFQPLTIDQALFINLENGNQSIVENEEAKILVNSLLFGKGKIVATTIPSTFNWVLNDFKNDYSSYWSQIINKASRKSNQNFDYATEPVFPTISKPIAIIVEQTAADKISQIQIESTLLAPQQNSFFPTLSKTVFWPKQTGWNTVKINNQLLLPFYIYDTTSWISVRNTEIINANKLFAKNHIQKFNPSDNIIKVEKEVSKWWFFLSFLLSAGFLWYELRMN